MKLRKIAVCILLSFHFWILKIQAQQLKYPLSYQYILSNRYLPDPSGKIIVIDFWATWCAPCISKFDQINALIKGSDPQKVVFVAITDEKKEIVESFFKRRNKKLDAFILIDSTRDTQKKYRVEYLPRTVIVDSLGAILWEGDIDSLSLTMISSERFVKKSNDKKNPESNFKKMSSDFESAFLFEVWDVSGKRQNSVEDQPNFEQYDGMLSDSDDIYFIDNLRTRLDYLITELTGFNSKKQLSFNDSFKQKMVVDLKFNNNYYGKPEVKKRYTKFSNMFIPHAINKNVVLLMLSRALGFKIVKEIFWSSVFELKIKDSALLQKARSAYKNRSSYDFYKRETFEFVNYSLPEIVKLITQNYSYVFNCSLLHGEKFDMTLKCNNLDSLAESLKSYGLIMEKKEKKLERLKFVFY